MIHNKVTILWKHIWAKRMVGFS